jgi:hypothetical protein
MPARKPRPHELPLQFLPTHDGSGLAAEATHILDRTLIGSTESSVAAPGDPAASEVGEEARRVEPADGGPQVVIDEHCVILARPGALASGTTSLV